MRPTKLRAAIAGAAAIAIVAGVLVATRGDLWPERHTEGWGPLSSYGTATMGFSGQGPEWTIGVPVCLARGIEPAVLDGSVTGLTQIGEGFRFLGAAIRQGRPSKGFGVIGSVEGFPPTPPYDDSKAAKGFAVTSPCEAGNAILTATYTELDVGVGRLSSAGGGWDGFQVGYTVGWRHHVLTVQGTVVACGPDVPPDYCGGAAPSA